MSSPSEHQEHFMQCQKCGKDFDMRDLSEVMHHEFDCLNTTIVTQIPYTRSKREGDNVEWTNDKKPIYLN